jgi:hypothetical protein
MRGVAGSFEFGVLLSEGRRGVTDRIGGMRRWKEELESNASD